MKKTYRFLARVLLMICSVTALAVTAGAAAEKSDEQINWYEDDSYISDKQITYFEDGSYISDKQITYFEDGSYTVITTITGPVISFPDDVDPSIIPPEDADPANYPDEYPEYCEFLNQLFVENGCEPVFS